MDWDFTANESVEDVNKVPESFRSVYTEGDDGKYVINPELKGVVGAITGLNTALGKERKAAKDAKGQRSAADVLKELGFEDEDGAKAKIQELTDAAAKGANVDPEKIKAELQKTFDADAQAKDEKLSNMQGTLEKYMIKSAAVGALAEAKGNAKLLMPTLLENVKLVEDGDEYVVRVVDGDGDYRGDGKGGFMSVEDFVAEMKASDDYAVAFESDALSGGDKPAKGLRQPSTRKVLSKDAGDMTSAQKIAQGLEQRRRGR